MKIIKPVTAAVAFWAGLFLTTRAAEPEQHVATALVGSFDQRWHDRAPCNVDAVFANCSELSSQELLHPKERQRRLKDRPVTYGPEIPAVHWPDPGIIDPPKPLHNVEIWIRN